MLGVFASAAAASAWSPLDLDPDFYWEADQAGAIGDFPTAIPDLSGNGRDMVNQGTPAQLVEGPNGLATLQCGGGGAGYMGYRAEWDSPGTYVPWSIFTVARAISPLLGGRLLSGIYTEHRNWLVGWWNGFQNVCYCEGFVRNGSDGISDDWNAYGATSDGTSTTAFYEGATITAENGSGYAGPNGGLAINGYSLHDSSETLNLEFLMCAGVDTRRWSPEEYALLPAYADAKWSVGVS